MNFSFEEISELSSPLVRFYSIKLGSEAVCEFELFDEQIVELVEGHEFLEEELQIIYTSIEEMRLKRGAQSYFFRPEGPAEALPVVSQLMMEQNNENYGLRLYCIRLNRYAVVLLNGGIKTKLNPIECPNVSIHFDRALKVGRIIAKALKDGFLQLDRDKFTWDDIDFDL